MGLPVDCAVETQFSLKLQDEMSTPDGSDAGFRVHSRFMLDVLRLEFRECLSSRTSDVTDESQHLLFPSVSSAPSAPSAPSGFEISVQGLDLIR